MLLFVEPVLSPASHIWGPLSFGKRLRASPFSTKSEGVHASYLRIMAGASKSACLDVIYRDFHRIPVMYHWPRHKCLPYRTAGWWTKMSQARHGEQSMACRAWVEDVQLARAGCATCQSSHLLHTLCSLSLLDGGWRQQPLDWLLGRSWEEGVVQNKPWMPYSRPAGRAPSLRTHVSLLLGGSLCVSMRYGFILLAPQLISTPRATAPAHTRLCLPFTQLRNLAQLRIGCAHLEVEQGRKRRPKVPRHDRLCKLCSGEDASLACRLAAFSRTVTNRNVEDLKHRVSCPESGLPCV